MASQEAPPDKTNEAEVKRHFKAYFIREIFLNNVFKSNHLFYGENTSHGYELANQLMINQFSNQLSDSNFIDLSQVTLDEK
tara:strand:+ start:378 stop:620 length:243 start_codon:yes stop_codon:yes gene_type:complete